MGILNIHLNNIKLVNTNYDGDDPDTIIHVRLFAWHIKFEKRKALKIQLNEELMSIAWHPKRWWNFCLLEDEKKEIIRSNAFNASLVYNLEILRHFVKKNYA